jgi:hypothetical protein
MSITTVREALQKQAAFIRKQGEKKSKVDLLKEIINELEAPTPTKFSFKSITKKKTVEEFSKNAEKSAMRDLDLEMAAYKWIKYHQDDSTGTRSFSNRDFKHYRIEHKAGKFTVYYKNDVHVTGMHARNPHTLEFMNPGRFLKQGK